MVSLNSRRTNHILLGPPKGSSLLLHPKPAFQWNKECLRAKGNVYVMKRKCDICEIWQNREKKRATASMWCVSTWTDTVDRVKMTLVSENDFSELFMWVSLSWQYFWGIWSKRGGVFLFKSFWLLNVRLAQVPELINIRRKRKSVVGVWKWHPKVMTMWNILQYFVVWENSLQTILLMAKTKWWAFLPFRKDSAGEQKQRKREGEELQWCTLVLLSLIYQLHQMFHLWSTLNFLFRSFTFI